MKRPAPRTDIAGGPTGILFRHRSTQAPAPPPHFPQERLPGLRPRRSHCHFALLREEDEFRRPQLDRFDRDAALIEKRNALGLLGGRIARSAPTCIAGDLALLGRRLPLGRGEHLCERELLGILQHAQPLDPMLQGLDGGRQ